jgi:hypothetical protein
MIVINLPIGVEATTSPYPTVDIVIRVNHTESPRVENSLECTLGLTVYVK